MNAMNLTVSTPTVATSSSTNQKAGTATNTGVNFADLFVAMRAESQVVGEQNTSSNQQGELLAKLEDLLQTLQALPQETLTPEEQELMAAIVQMLSLQTTQMKELTTNNEVAPEKLMLLLDKINQELQKISTSTTPFEGTGKLAGVDEKILADPQKNEQVFKQLVAFIQQVDTELRAAGKPIPLQQAEQMEQVLKQLTEVTQDMEGQAKMVEPERKVEQLLTPTQRPTGNPVAQPQEAAGEPAQPVQMEGNSQPLTGPTVDMAKAAQPAQRPEGTAQTPTVRMSNLIEELGGVLKNSFRLNGGQEGTQIRVNIAPDHLGHLDIRLTAIDGKIAAQIFTSNLLAKEALDLQINQLRSSLMQQGVTVDRIEISQQSSGQSMGQQQAHPDQRFTQQQQKQGNTSHKNGYQRMEEEATAERIHLAEGTMKVDYTI